MKKTIANLILVSICLVACSKKETDTNITQQNQVKDQVITPAIGGSNQPNQVYVNLATSTTTNVNRATWDLAFYSGDEFRVALNGAVFMGVKKTQDTDMSLPQKPDKNVYILGGFNASKNGFCDHPSGNIIETQTSKGTAIEEISKNDENNKVYLLQLGVDIATKTPPPGGVSIEGTPRGWKKIRILRNATSGYKIQYANLEDSTFKEVIINKNNLYHFTFYSLISHKTINVQPEKKDWDICFTTFTNYIPSGDEEVTYGFADFVVSNMLAKVGVYTVLNTEKGYDQFTKKDVIENNFIPSYNDQRIIGASWRIGGTQTGGLPSLKTDRFYIIKNTQGKYFKLKFLTMINDKGERGNTKFQYAHL